MHWGKKIFHYKLNDQIPLSTPINHLNCTVIDTETTGLSVHKSDRLIEIGAVSIKHLQVNRKHFHTYVNPDREIPEEIIKLTGISQEKVIHAPRAIEGIKGLFDFLEAEHSACLVGHNVEFDFTVIKKELWREKNFFDKPIVFDTVDLIQNLYPRRSLTNIEEYAKYFATPIFERHTAIGDAMTTAYLFVELLKQLEARGFTTWGDLLHITDRYKRRFAY